MPELVVVVARTVYELAQPFACRNLGVSVMPAHHEDDAVNQDQGVNQRRQWKSFSRRPQHDAADHCGRDLEAPGREVLRVDSRPDKDCEKYSNPCPFHCASSSCVRQKPSLLKPCQTHGSQRNKAKLNHKAHARISNL